MMKLLSLLSTTSLLYLASAQGTFDPLIPTKLRQTALASPGPNRSPQYTTANGTWVYFGIDGWTTGFFPATLYAQAERLRICRDRAVQGPWSQQEWLGLGRKWATAMLSLTQGNGQGHDQGFLAFPFVEELKINPQNQTAIKAVNDFATILANRFDSVVGATRSWDFGNPDAFTVIIDNMMNLELLYLSAGFTGNKTLISIANTHADTSARTFIRPDGGTYHVVEFDQATGGIIKRRTQQGYSDESTWTRGHAWSIYGFANIYRLAKKEAYLQTARRLADYYLGRLPPSYIVPWDFDSPEQFADASGAMVAAAGLVMLANEETSRANKARYYGAAKKLLKATSDFAWSPTWQSLLSNGTVNHPANNQLTGIVYGDYYYVLAGNELVKAGQAKC